MTDKAKAIELADWADWFCRNVKDPEDFRWKHMADSSQELRRLHAENLQLRDAFEQQTAGHQKTLDEWRIADQDVRRLHAENEKLKDLCGRSLRALMEEDFPVLRDELRQVLGHIRD